MPEGPESGRGGPGERIESTSAAPAPDGVGPVAEPGSRRRSVRRVLWWVLAANLAVIVAKVAVGIRTGSIAVLGIAADSGIDALNNVVGLAAVRVAATPPDEEHPYGHGKFETLGALAVVSFLSITCFELVRSGVARLATDVPPPDLSAAAFWVLGATLPVNLLVSWMESRKGRDLDSEILRADARHTLADGIVTAGVLVGLALVTLGWTRGDGWIGLMVAVMIGYNGFQILRQTVPVLVDRRALTADRIRMYVRETPGVMAATEIRSRGRPGEAFAELTIHVHPEKNVAEAHRVADRVERRLEEEGFAGVVVHVEPGPRPRESSHAARSSDTGSSGHEETGREGEPAPGGGG